MIKSSDRPDYEILRSRCQQTSSIIGNVVDDFLISFAARQHGLEKRIDRSFARYSRLLRSFDRSGVLKYKAQLISHSIFRRGGLIGKFMNHPALGRFTDEERTYLKQQENVPWRFSFSELTGEPAQNFYTMRDVFTEEEFLLYSPTIGEMKKEGTKLLWFNLIGYNGLCWQSYGPIGAFQSFSADDIWFFATEKNPVLGERPEVADDIDNDPLPYMMLMAGSNNPRTFNKNEEIIILMAEHDAEEVDTSALREHFISEYNDGVYQFTHKQLGSPPHFARAYYDENEKVLLFHALTETGFKGMIKDFNAYGYGFTEIPFLKVRPAMLSTAGDILNKEIELNEYEELFDKDTDAETDKEVERLNDFLGLVIPAFNEGREPDIDEAVRITGIDPENARELVKMFRDKQGEKSIKEEPAQGDRKKRVKKSTIGMSGKRPELFSTLYGTAKEIYSLKPWETLYETDIFGVKMPGSGTTWFISVMGGLGEYFAIAAYKDYEGLFGFYGIKEQESSAYATNLFTVPHLLISFTDRDELSKKDIDAITKSGISFRGKGQWPKLEEVVPGFVPEFPDQETLDELPLLLEEVATVLNMIKDNPGILQGKQPDDDKILIRVPTVVDDIVIWVNHYKLPDPENHGVKYNLKFSVISREKVSGLRSSKKSLQVDLLLLPAPVRNPGKRDFFPFILLLMDKESGMIAGMETLGPDPDIKSMYESVPQKVLDSIIKLGYRPGKTEFRSELLYGLTKQALAQSGCSPVQVKSMPLMDEAFESLLDRFAR